MDSNALWFRILLACVTLLGIAALAVLVLVPRGVSAPQEVVTLSSGTDITTTIANVILALAAIAAFFISLRSLSVSQQGYAIEVQPVLMLACRVGEASKPEKGWTYAIDVPYGGPIGDQVVATFGQGYVGMAKVGTSAYQCTLYNYGRLPALNVKLSFRIALRADSNPASEAVTYDLVVPNLEHQSEIHVPTGGSFSLAFINTGKLHVFITPNATASMAKIGSQNRQEVTLNFGQFTFAANFLPHGELLHEPNPSP